MRPFRVGGYNGTVIIERRDGTVLGYADCRSIAQQDYDGGAGSWHGQLRRLNPPVPMSAAVYQVRFPTGEQGDVRVQASDADSAVRYFAGVGSHPLYPR